MDVQLFMNYPSNLSNLLTLLQQGVVNVGLWFFPINMGNCHWTLLCLDFEANSKLALYVDPAGAAMPLSLSSVLSQWNFQIVDCLQTVQYDNFPCGVWICWCVDRILDHCATAPLSSFTLLNLVHVNSCDPTERLENTQLIALVRKMFSDQLLNSYQRRTLLVV